MKNYKVEEIAKITGTNEETVRRWIRDGKLPNSALSVKGESKLVSETDLISFLRQTPKYMSKAVENIAKYAKKNKEALMISAAVGLIGGGLAAIIADSLDDNSETEKKAAEIAVNKEIELSQNEIIKKKEQIKKLQEEIEKEEAYLKELNTRKESKA